jgi:hypothetical protein
MSLVDLGPDFPPVSSEEIATPPVWRDGADQ